MNRRWWCSSEQRILGYLLLFMVSWYCSVTFINSIDILILMLLETDRSVCLTGGRWPQWTSWSAGENKLHVTHQQYTSYFIQVLTLYFTVLSNTWTNAARWLISVSLSSFILFWRNSCKNPWTCFTANKLVSENVFSEFTESNWLQILQTNNNNNNSNWFLTCLKKISFTGLTNV